MENYAFTLGFLRGPHIAHHFFGIILHSPHNVCRIYENNLSQIKLPRLISDAT